MSGKIELNVNQYGDELLRRYVNGDDEGALNMYSAVQKAASGAGFDDNLQTLIAFHWYQNEGIVDKTVAAVVVDCCLTLQAQGHPMFSRPATTIEDEKKEVQQQWLDGLITQSEMAAKLKSLDSK